MRAAPQEQARSLVRLSGMPEKISVRKARRLRTLLAKHYKLPDPPERKESFVDEIVMTVLWENAPAARVRLAYENLADEFVDWNELRVSVTSDVAAVLESCGLPGRKGAVLKRILARGIEDIFSFDFEELVALPRERLKAWFTNIEGVPHSTAAHILYHVYDYDRVPVGEDIARVIRRLGLVNENATVRDIEPALNAVVPAKDAHSIYNALWQHATTVCTTDDFDCKKCPLRPECEGGKVFIAERIAQAKAAKIAAREKAKAEKAAAKEKAKAEAKAKIEAKAKAEAKARAEAKAKAKAKAKAEAKAKAKTKAKTKTKTKTKAKAAAKPKPKASPKVASATKAKAGAKPKASTKAKAKTSVKRTSTRATTKRKR